MHNFQNLNWSGELSYVEGEVEVVSPDHDASDYYESQGEKNSNSEMLLPQQCYFLINERQRDFTYYINTNESPNHFTLMYF